MTTEAVIDLSAIKARFDNRTCSPRLAMASAADVGALVAEVERLRVALRDCRDLSQSATSDDVYKRARAALGDAPSTAPTEDATLREFGRKVSTMARAAPMGWTHDDVVSAVLRGVGS